MLVKGYNAKVKIGDSDWIPILGFTLATRIENLKPPANVLGGPLDGAHIPPVPRDGTAYKWDAGLERWVLSN